VSGPLVRGGWILALLGLLACPAAPSDPTRPAGYPTHYPLLPGAQTTAGGAPSELRYPKDPGILAEELLAALAAEGWTVTFDSKLDPTAGRLIGAQKNGETVIANVGQAEGQAVLVVRPAVAPGP
jgi:hypothetical protein